MNIKTRMLIEFERDTAYPDFEPHDARSQDALALAALAADVATAAKFTARVRVLTVEHTEKPDA